MRLLTCFLSHILMNSSRFFCYDLSFDSNLINYLFVCLYCSARDTRSLLTRWTSAAAQSQPCSNAFILCHKSTPGAGLPRGSWCELSGPKGPPCTGGLPLEHFAKAPEHWRWWLSSRAKLPQAKIPLAPAYERGWHSSNRRRVY